MKISILIWGFSGAIRRCGNTGLADLAIQVIPCSRLVVISSLSFFLKEFLYFYYFYLFIYLWLCWVFVSVRGLSLVAASGGHSSLRCAGLSPSRPLLWRSTGSRCAGSVVVAHGPSCSTACGIFPDQGSNPCPLHWQADSQPLHHQGSPISSLHVGNMLFCSHSFYHSFLSHAEPASLIYIIRWPLKAIGLQSLV